MEAPTPKVTTGLAAGAITTILVSELHSRFHIDIDGNEAAALTTLFSFVAAYFTPHPSG